jgi:hypothetical protein
MTSINMKYDNAFPGKFKYLHVDVYDFEQADIYPYFDRAADFIRMLVEILSSHFFKWKQKQPELLPWYIVPQELVDLQVLCLLI